MSQEYDPAFDPPAPVLSIRIAAPGETPQALSVFGVVDTGADGTLIPTSLLEQVEAIGVGDATLRSALGEVREVHLYEVDVHFDFVSLPGILVAGDDRGNEILLGRNILNKLILLLDGQSKRIDLFQSRPHWR
jgi:predicted aspartyl protease